MNRLASLDYLRGAAALAVAIPHYLMLGSTEWPAAQVISILAVEVFFVLSGFVLAPQVIHCLQSPRAADTGTFLVRRWMRTIPPYLAALGIVTLITGNIYAPALLPYVFYVQNFFRALPETLDYFPVAWSLSVEEWYYAVIALLVLLARWAGLGAKAFAGVIVAFIAATILLRFIFSDMAHWDAEVRRVTLFRMVSIAAGFLLYWGSAWLANVFSGGRRLLLPVLLGLLALAGAYAGWQATVHRATFWQHVYPFAATLFAAVLIFMLAAGWQRRLQSGILAGTGFFMGKISYSIYLFHLPFILVLRGQLTHLPLGVQLLVYALALMAFCTAFYFSFEAPILAARPHYKKQNGPQQSAGRSFSLLPRALEFARGFRSRNGLLAASGFAIFVASIAAAERLQFPGRPAPFYAALIVAALGLCGGLAMSGLWRRRPPRLIALFFLLFAVLLPAADSLHLRSKVRDSKAPVKPVYAFRDAQGNPEAFQIWWQQYARAWQTSRQGIEMPDPERKLPFVLKPGSRGYFFDSPLDINNHGFRGADIAAAKGDSYRIFVLGESPTFGPMIGKGDETWVAALQHAIDSNLACKRPVEIVNAGFAGYTIVHGIEHLRRFVLPLQPDMVIAYHGYNSVPLADADLAKMPTPPNSRQRGSPLISEASFRLRALKYAAATRRLFSSPPSPYTDVYEKSYSELSELAKAHRFHAVIASLSLAVNESSPRDVIDFYGRVFQPISRILPVIAHHNRVARETALRTGAHFIDTSPGLDGEWDKDAFIDIVHFTHSGARKLAANVFAGLAPLLRADGGPDCVDRVNSTNDKAN